MKHRQIITAADYKILLHIAKEGGKTQKQLLEKKVVKSTKTVYFSLKKMEYFNLLESYQRANSGKGTIGRKATGYKLSLEGVLVVSYFLFKEKINQFEEFAIIALKNKELLPLVFGKWSYFIKNHLEEEIIARFFGAAISVQSKLEAEIEVRYAYLDSLKNKFGETYNLPVGKKLESWLKSYDKEMTEIADNVNLHWKNVRHRILDFSHLIDDESKRIIEDLITQRIFFGSINSMIEPRTETNFLKIIVKDKELKAYVSSYLTKAEKCYEKYLNNIRCWKSLVADSVLTKAGGKLANHK